MAKFVKLLQAFLKSCSNDGQSKVVLFLLILDGRYNMVTSDEISSFLRPKNYKIA